METTERLRTTLREILCAKGNAETIEVEEEFDCEECGKGNHVTVDVTDRTDDITDKLRLAFGLSGSPSNREVDAALDAMLIPVLPQSPVRDPDIPNRLLGTDDRGCPINASQLRLFAALLAGIQKARE